MILDPGPVRPIPQDFYDCCNVITPNETEAQALVGFPVTDRESAARAAQRLLDRGVELAVVTLGAQGAVYATGQMSGYVAPFPVTAWIRSPRATPLTARWPRPLPGGRRPAGRSA